MSEPPSSGSGHIEYEFDIDGGDVAPGHRLLARGLCLFDDQLSLNYAWVPGLSHRYGEGDVAIEPNVWYDADVSPASQNMVGGYGPCDGGPVTEGRLQYDRPPTTARFAYFDFFKPEFDVLAHVDRHWRPDAEYLENRVSRLTVDLRTGHAEL